MKAKKFKYEIVKIIPLEELENFKDHRRMKVFYNKGVICVNSDCKIVGTQLALGIDKKGNMHIDVYNDEFYPLTVDHRIPKSKGGSDDLENLDPMCYDCNQIKGDKLENELSEIYKDNSLKKSELSPLTTQDFGLPVFKRNKKSNYRCIGFVDKFIINPHSNKLSFMIEGNSTSMYSMKQGFIQKSFLT